MAKRALTTGTRVAAIFQSDAGYNRGMLRGFGSFAVAAGWATKAISPGPELEAELGEWDPAGVVVEIKAFQIPNARDLLRALGRPVVGAAVDVAWVGGPSVDVDDVRVGTLAAEHLLERGYRSFGIFAPPQPGWPAVRSDAFETAVREAGHPCSRYTQLTTTDYDRGVRRQAEPATVEWLRGLPKPAGVFATNDSGAVSLLRLCGHAGVRVPEDVAVLGVDNDALVCELTHPPLSSVEVPFERIGFEAGALLERMLAGEVLPTEPVRFAPTGVVVRQSTDTVAIDDAEVVAALRFIREHATEPLGMTDLLRAVPTYRHRLERGFRRHLGRTVMEEVRRVRVERAKRMLTTTDLSVEEIAVRCGFANASKFGIAFRKETRQTPTEHRRRSRPPGQRAR